MAKSNLFLIGSIFFLVGVFAASSSWDVFVSLATLGGGILFFILVKGKNFFSLTLLILVFSAFLGGFFYYNFYLNLRGENQRIVFDRPFDFKGVVVDEPIFREKFQEVAIDLEKPFFGKMKVLLPLSPKFRYGDLVGFRGVIVVPAEGYFYPVSFFPKADLLGEHLGFWLKEKLLDFKFKQISVFREYLSQDQAALISGITYGFRGDFTEEFKMKMNRSGTTHIVALSGYNIAILVSVIFFAANRYFSRRKTFYLTIIVISLFVMMVGGEASVVRAAIMGFLVLLAREAGRMHQAFRVIVFSALLMVLFNPTILRYDLSFQLSFLSLLGLVYLEPIFREFLRIKDDDQSFMSWKTGAITTLSAQLMVVPFILGNFGQFSVFSILANVLILETLPLVMFFGFLVALGGLIFSVLGFIVAKFLGIFLAYQIGVMSFFSKFYIALSGGIFSGPLAATYYAIILGIIYFKNATKHQQS